MTLSTLVIFDINCFEKIVDFWDMEVADHVDSPFLSSCMLIEHWKLSIALGDHPFLMIFLSGNRIVGFAPLLMKSSFGLRQASNLAYYIYPDFFSDDYREIGIDILVSFLIDELNCESVDITFENESANLIVLKKICDKRNISYEMLANEGQAIIQTKNTLDFFKRSLGRKTVKEFRRISKKIDRTGSWKISCFGMNCSSIQKIREIERLSWKTNLRGKQWATKNLGLECIINGAQVKSKCTASFDSEVWILNINEVPTAYVIAAKRNKTLFLLKTSFDLRFKEFWPGKFLINNLIERVFTDKIFDNIDFITNLHFVQTWKPLVKKRATVRILRKSLLSKVNFLVFENRISHKSLQIIERFRWERMLRQKEKKLV